MRARRKTRRQARRRVRWNLRERLRALKLWVRPALITLAVVVSVASAWRGYDWLMQPSTLPIRSITLAGELKYVDPAELQALLKSEVDEGFFSIDLAAIKQRLEALPWIYQVSLRRIWPDRLQITVEEQRPIARWGDRALVNRYGDIFDASPRETDLELPVIFGRRDRCQALIREFNEADEMLYPLGLKLVSLTEDERGDQRLLLANGTRVALGRKHRFERLQRLVASYRGTLQPMIADVSTLDLRYPNGFAVKWKEGMLKTGRVRAGQQP